MGADIGFWSNPEIRTKDQGQKTGEGQATIEIQQVRKSQQH